MDSAWMGTEAEEEVGRPQGFYNLRDAGLPPPESYAEAAAALAQLRRILTGTRRSTDYAAETEETMQRNAQRLRRSAHAMWSFLESTGTDDPSPPAAGPSPAYFFTPMATAPASMLWLPGEGGVAAAPSAEGRRRPSPTGHTAAAPQRMALRTGGRWGASVLPTPVAATATAPRRSSARPLPKNETSDSARGSGDGRLFVSLPGSRQRRSSAPAAGVRPAAPGPSPPALQGDRSDRQCLEDAEREAAVRDYLRRVNILAEDADASAPPFADAVMNGGALCQLLRCIAAPAAGEAGDPVPCRSPRSLDDVRLNYTAALSVLSALPAAAAAVPAEFYRITPEEIYRCGRPTRLLALYVRLIAHHLPPPEQLYRGGAADDTGDAIAQLTWQPPADAPGYDAGPQTARQLWETERRACRLLFAAGVLPDPAAHALPPDECLVPGPLAAPVVAVAGSPTGAVVPRAVAPAALYVPSVFPFLANGVALCALARRIADGAPATPFAAPKTRASCLKNISAALHVLAGATGAVLPASLAESIFRGNRRAITAVLGRVADCLEGPVTPRPGAAPRSPPPSTAVAAIDRSAEKGAVSRAGCGDSAAAVVGANEGEPLVRWFVSSLGHGFRFTAEDGSYAFDSGQFFALEDPCLVFSDGVVLAHLIRTLERCRCEELECVRPTSKRAAKRFNVRRCLQFLQKQKGILMPIVGLDEALIAGDPAAVLRVLKSLKARYS